MDLALRRLTADDFDEYFAVDCAAFSATPKPEDRAQAEATTEWDRTFGAFDGAALCGTAGAYEFAVTLPGGGVVPTSGVTAVAVLPTHRRRGVLTALMQRQLADVVERGEVLALLTASEATIYGRFGYGLATEDRKIEIVRARSRFARPTPDGLATRMITKAEAVERAPAWFDAFRRARVGEVSRPASWWPVIFGDHETWKGGGDIFVVACEPTDGRPGGYASYKVDHERPAGSVLTVRDLVAADADVRGALWRFLLDVDLIDTIEASVAPDDDLRWRLVDWRGCRVTGTEDFLWARVVDPAGALAARRYPVADAYVIELDDPFLPTNSGCYQVAGGPDHAEAERVPPTADADLVMDVSALGSIYLGGFSPSQLARAGRLAGRSDEVLARADRFFAAGGPGPFCSTSF